MKLNSVIFADDSESCDIADFCVLLKNSTIHVLEQYVSSCDNIDLNNKVCLSDYITKGNLSDELALINNDNFICFWYGHGNTDSFCIDNESIITTTENHYIFSNALIYTFSCFNGGELADVLIANNAKTFVGYTGLANCPYGIGDITLNVAMTFIESFIKGKTVNESKEDLIASYENAIFNEELEPFQRSSFQQNRDNLIVKGNGNLCIDDMLTA